MNREFLKGLGLEDEVINQIMAEHGKTVNKIKEQLETTTTERDSLKEQLEERDKQLDNLSKQVKDNEELTAEINRLKEENQKTAQELQSKLEKQAFEFNLEKALTNAKVRNPKAVKALLDTDVIKLDGDKLLGLEEQLKSIKESDPYLFEDDKQQTPKPQFTTGQHQTGGAIDFESFKKMSYKERLELKRSNPEKYKQLTEQ